MDSAADCKQARCQAPAKLALQQVPQQAVRLQAAPLGQGSGHSGGAGIPSQHHSSCHYLYLPWMLLDRCVLYIGAPCLYICVWGRC